MIGIQLSDAPPSPLADEMLPTDGLLELVTLQEDLCAVFFDGIESGELSQWSRTDG